MKMAMLSVTFQIVLFAIMSCVMAEKLESSSRIGRFGVSYDTGGAETLSRGRRGAGDCRGGSGMYKSLWNTRNMNSADTSKSVEDCFESLRRLVEENARHNVFWGCYTRSTASGCRCTVDSTYMWAWSYKSTFEEAYNNLKPNTQNFNSYEAERHEGAMYITYTCPKTPQTYPQVLSGGGTCTDSGNKAESLKFRAGDVIYCKIKPDRIFDHVMLATSDSTVAHAEGGSGNLGGSSANLREDRWSRILCSFDDCYVDSQDQICKQTIGPTILHQDNKCYYTANESVQQARKDIKEKGTSSVYYHILGCNCEHWVQRWKNGLGYSRQSLQFANSDCPMYS